MIFAILWALQTLCFVYLYFDLRHEFQGRLDYHRMFLLILAERLGIPIEEVNEKVEQRKEWLRSQNK